MTKPSPGSEATDALPFGPKGEALHGLEHYQSPDNFGRLIGYEVVAFDRDTREAEVRLEIDDRHLSASGKAHGGSISALLDFACGVAVCTTLGPKDLTSTVELKVNYFRPARKGDKLAAKAKVAFRGKRLCALSAYLYRIGDAEPVAMATATYNVAENVGEAPPK
jgi:uncharacterized protein (TIGR00369 family)